MKLSPNAEYVGYPSSILLGKKLDYLLHEVVEHAKAYTRTIFCGTLHSPYVLRLVVVYIVVPLMERICGIIYGILEALKVFVLGREVRMVCAISLYINDRCTVQNHIHHVRRKKKKKKKKKKRTRQNKSSTFPLFPMEEKKDYHLRNCVFMRMEVVERQSYRKAKWDQNDSLSCIQKKGSFPTTNP